MKCSPGEIDEFKFHFFRNLSEMKQRTWPQREKILTSKQVCLTCIIVTISCIFVGVNNEVAFPVQ